jgi:anti-sigma factor RsiW
VKQKPHERLGEDRFRALAAAYGADLARWPLDERHAAEELLATSSEAAACLAEQHRLDELLDGVPDVVPSPALLRGVAEIPVRHGMRPGERSLWPFDRLRNWLSVVAAAAAMGIIVGVTTSNPTPADEAEASLDELSMTALAVDLSEELSP